MNELKNSRLIVDDGTRNLSSLSEIPEAVSP
jgi:hypothetical protein